MESTITLFTLFSDCPSARGGCLTTYNLGKQFVLGRVQVSGRAKVKQYNVVRLIYAAKRTVHAYSPPSSWITIYERYRTTRVQ